MTVGDRTGAGRFGRSRSWRRLAPAWSGIGVKASRSRSDGAWRPYAGKKVEVGSEVGVGCRHWLARTAAGAGIASQSRVLAIAQFRLSTMTPLAALTGAHARSTAATTAASSPRGGSPPLAKGVIAAAQRHATSRSKVRYFRCLAALSATFRMPLGFVPTAVTLAFHVRAAEVLFGGEYVVSLAAEAQILKVVFATESESL